MAVKKHAYLHVQLSFLQLRALRRAAKNEGMTLSAYIRFLADKFIQEQDL